MGRKGIICLFHDLLPVCLGAAPRADHPAPTELDITRMEGLGNSDEVGMLRQQVSQRGAALHAALEALRQADERHVRELHTERAVVEQQVGLSQWIFFVLCYTRFEDFQCVSCC